MLQEHTYAREWTFWRLCVGSVLEAAHSNNIVIQLLVVRIIAHSRVWRWACGLQFTKLICEQRTRQMRELVSAQTDLSWALCIRKRCTHTGHIHKHNTAYIHAQVYYYDTCSMQQLVSAHKTLSNLRQSGGFWFVIRKTARISCRLYAILRKKPYMDTNARRWSVAYMTAFFHLTCVNYVQLYIVLYISNTCSCLTGTRCTRWLMRSWFFALCTFVYLTQFVWRFCTCCCSRWSTTSDALRCNDVCWCDHVYAAGATAAAAAQRSSTAVNTWPPPCGDSFSAMRCSHDRMRAPRFATGSERTRRCVAATARIWRGWAPMSKSPCAAWRAHPVYVTSYNGTIEYELARRRV